MKVAINAARWTAAIGFAGLALWFLLRAEPVGELACVIAAAGCAP